MSDEPSNGAVGPLTEGKPLDYWVCEQLPHNPEHNGLNLRELRGFPTSAEAAKEVKRLLGAPDAEGRVYFVLNRVYGPITLRARVERVSVKVDGLEAKRTRPRKAKDSEATTAPTGEASAPSETPARSRRPRTAAGGTPASV